MWAYFSLLLFPLILAAGQSRPPSVQRLCFLLVWAGLTLFIGLRREITGDWDNYLVMFERARTYELLDALTISDPGYMLLNRIVAGLGLGIPIVNLICAAIFIGGLLLFVRSQPLPALALLIAVPVLIGVGAFTTRQSVAAGLLMAAMAFYSRGRMKLPSLLAAASILFHWTAAILMPLAPAMWLRRIPNWLIIAGGIAAGVGFVAAFVFVPGLSERFALVGQSKGAMFRGSVTLLALVVLFGGWSRLELNEHERRIAAYLAAAAIFTLLAIPVFPTAGDRLGYYAIPLQMLVLPRAVALFQSGLLRTATTLAVAAPYLVLFSGYLALTPYRPCLVPYRTYLTDLEAIRLHREPLRRSSECQEVVDRP